MSLKKKKISFSKSFFSEDFLKIFWYPSPQHGMEGPLRTDPGQISILMSQCCGDLCLFPIAIVFLPFLKTCHSHAGTWGFAICYLPFTACLLAKLLFLSGVGRGGGGGLRSVDFLFDLWFRTLRYSLLPCPLGFQGTLYITYTSFQDYLWESVTIYDHNAGW